MTTYLSKIDTERFGFPIAKVNHYRQSPRETIAQLKNEGVKLVMSRVSTRELLLLNELERLGFLTMDIQLTYSFDLKKNIHLPQQQQHDFLLRDAVSSDTGQIALLAKNAFAGYGHYFADKNLDAAKCNLIYEDWAKNSCASKSIADKIIVAESAGEILGFLSFKKTASQEIIAGGLGAVSANARGKGVFRAINVHGLSWAAGENVQYIQHNVLITNLPVNKTYSRLGFNIARSEITMHKWLACEEPAKQELKPAFPGLQRVS